MNGIHIPIAANATGETWPIMKFASQDAAVVRPTALARMLVCMISTGLGCQWRADGWRRELNATRLWQHVCSTQYVC